MEREREREKTGGKKGVGDEATQDQELIQSPLGWALEMDGERV